jgi:HD-GYP domain-containing protein (c-di-GMP phosphodiesterase class II)
MLDTNTCSHSVRGTSTCDDLRRIVRLVAEARLAELVAALSLGIDLGFGQPMEHVLGQCLIALRIAERLGLDEEERASVYYTALLINVGCHTDAYEQAKWFGDDIASKSIKYDHEQRSLRMAVTGLRYLGHGHPPLHRFRLGLEFVLSGHREVDGMIESHAAVARMLGEQLELPPSVLDSLGAAYERWDGRGWPGDLKGEQVPMPSRIAGAAEYFEVASRLGGVDAARRLARERRGKQFDPHVADVILSAGDEVFCDEVSTWSAVVDSEPGLAVVLDDQRLDAALAAIASFVDLKSPYFLGHARAVADLAAEAGAASGLGDHEVQRLRRAGLVHDLGRLGVSNAILDKRGPLGVGEWERLRLQPYITERMLHQSEALAPLTRNALPPPLGRILDAANAYQAMREPRPHREALEPDAAASELRRSGFDPEATEAVLGAAGHRVARRREGPAGLTPREVEVLRLLARGLSNKEIAARLSISPKTVGNHAEHIYAKIDAQSRAAAAFFAMQQGLLPEEEFPARVAA